MTEKQLELTLPRKRVQIVSEEAQAVKVEPVLDMEAFIGYSPWVRFSDAHPPMTGWWDVKDDSRRLGQTRAHFDAKVGVLTLQNWPFPVGYGSACWRGLAAPWPVGETKPDQDHGIHNPDHRLTDKPKRRALID